MQLERVGDAHVTQRQASVLMVYNMWHPWSHMYKQYNSESFVHIGSVIRRQVVKRNSSFSSFLISMIWFGSVFSTLLSKISWQLLAVLLCIWSKYSGKMMIHTRFGNPLTLHLVPPSGQTFPHEQHLNMVSWRHKKTDKSSLPMLLLEMCRIPFEWI